MNRAKNQIVASIARAQIELDDALEDLKAISMVDPMVLGFISHALGNYLHVTSATVTLLGEALKDHPRKEVGVWLQGLQNLSTRMMNLVEVMRSRPTKTPPQMRFESIDLTSLVGRACDFYRRIAARKQVEILFEKSSAPPAKVRTDRIAVAAVLDNLLSNAVKFSATGKWISVDLRREADGIVCRVQDQGPGIRTEDRASLFQRSLQLKAKPDSESPGGYGLAVAAELVAHLGGEIGCESERGKGACFFFRLPCSRNRRAALRRR